ncbi:MAG: DsbC family protein [Caldimicrobium sp.]
MFKVRFLLFIMISMFLLLSCKGGSPGIGKSTCPKLEDFQKVLHTLPQGIVLEKIEKTPISGLCEVVIKLSDTDKTIFYTDSSGKFIISGNIIEIGTMKNLTAERLAILNKRMLNEEQMKELEKVVAFTWGKGEKYIYFITDPDCPFCKQAERMLEDLVKKGLISVKVIFFPIEQIHPQAKEKAISILCDNKGYEGLKSGYLSKNQCEKGKAKVEESINVVQKIKIKGTPTFVFPDGEMKSGVLPPDVILSKLGVK